MISRRNFLKLFAGSLACGAGVAGYSIGVEPFRLNIQRYQLRPENWPENFKLKIAALADLHICKPWVDLDRLSYIVDQTNAQKPDIILLLGDYVSGMRFKTADIQPSEWAPVMGHLKAPLGVHGVLGNHDWWEDPRAQKTRQRPTAAGQALQDAGVKIYENDGIRLEKNGQPFWILGLGDQVPFYSWRKGRDDLTKTMKLVSDDAPAILMMHEPDKFTDVPDRVSLTLAGHTHGGQVRILGYSPKTPSRFGNRYAYGHVIENNRHLIISGGIGMSIMPVRLGVPPEITMVELG